MSCDLTRSIRAFAADPAEGLSDGVIRRLFVSVHVDKTPPGLRRAIALAAHVTPFTVGVAVHDQSADEGKIVHSGNQIAEKPSLPLGRVGIAHLKARRKTSDMRNTKEADYSSPYSIFCIGI